MAPSRIADSVGRVLGDRYRLTRPLGTGASAHVYVAEDVSLRRRVAIKVLHPALAGDAAFLRRFRAEAQVVASLRHPNILTVFDWGEEGGSPYVVMELLEGGSLRSMLDSGYLLSPAQAAAVGADAARALDYAHRRGLVHRDIKPANLIFDDEGHVRVADFGLARALAEATWTEPVGAVVGTARYAAPEQVRGLKLDDRADVYSLAVLLVEATTGTVPFAADTTIGTLMARVERPLPVPDQTGPLQPVLEAAGTLDPAERLSASALVRALGDVAATLPPPAPLSLISPLLTGAVEEDEASPTEYPGRVRLFDGASVEEAEPAPPPRREEPPPVIEPAGSAEPAGTTPRRRRRWRWLVAAILVVVALAAAGAAYAVESGRFTPSHPVPNLVGATPAAAAAALDPLHLRLAVTGAEYSAAARAGHIIRQTPATGRLKEHRTVDVVVSKGPPPFPVPDLTGQTLARAKAILARAHLLLGSVEQTTSMTVKAGDVISQVPAGGQVLPGQSVDLTLSIGKPMVDVPNLTGTAVESFAGAQAALAQAPLQLRAVQKPVYSDTVPKGQVAGTIPTAGTSVAVGSPVVVEISLGPRLIPVPSVVNDSVGFAAQVLGASGFQVSGVNGNPTAGVTGTDPGQGTPLRQGSPVVIITG